MCTFPRVCGITIFSGMAVKGLKLAATIATTSVLKTLFRVMMLFDATAANAISASLQYIITTATLNQPASSNISH